MPMHAPQTCEFPAYLLTSDSPLPKVADAVKGGQALEYSGGGQPLVDHRLVRSQRLSGPAAGRA